MHWARKHRARRIFFVSGIAFLYGGGDGVRAVVDGFRTTALVRGSTSRGRGKGWASSPVAHDDDDVAGALMASAAGHPSRRHDLCFGMPLLHVDRVERLWGTRSLWRKAQAWSSRRCQMDLAERERSTLPSPRSVREKGTQRLRYTLSATAAGDSGGFSSGSENLDRLLAELEADECYRSQDFSGDREFHSGGYSELGSGKAGVGKKRKKKRRRSSVDGVEIDDQLLQPPPFSSENPEKDRSQRYSLGEDPLGSWWDVVDDPVPRGIDNSRRVYDGQQEQRGGGRENESGFQSDPPDGVHKRGKRRGRGRGWGKRAISDEDLFQDMLGGYKANVYDYGDSSSSGEKEFQVDGGVEGGAGDGRRALRADVNDQFLLDDLFGGRDEAKFEEEEEGAEGDQGQPEEPPPEEPAPRPTREIFAEAMAELAPELREMWTELQGVAGTAEAVPILQAIVKASPDGEVQPELFQALFPFELDPFQTQALRGLAQRNSVVVSAPTGSGKTVVGELAVYYALALGLRVFYTTPLKALSNQKFSDFRRQFGRDRVGLLTGDSSFNREAQVCVMTTEVFRNMLYDDGEDTGARAILDDVFAVVFDEFHYMNDRDRGTVWEESVISCPDTVLLVALSATMSNVGEIKDWVEHTHGRSSLVVSDFRPVPLTYWFATKDGLHHLFRDPLSGPGAPNGGRKKGERAGSDTFEESRANGKGFARSFRRRATRRRNQLPDRLRINDDLLLAHDNELRAVSLDAQDDGFGGRNSYRGNRGNGRDRGRSSQGRSDRRYSGGQRDGGGDRRGARRNMRNAAHRGVPSYAYLVRCLGRKDLLPAIVFIFSRVGCDQAARQVGQDSAALLSKEERRTVRERLNAFVDANPQVPIPESWRQLLLLGISTHHAGLLPVFKSFVEELFAEALVKVVFATETLAAGVNMPARATVITTLSKRIDTGIVKLNPSQLLQMGGRAGRRGKDTSGAVVLMRSKYEDCLEAHRLLLSPLDGIESQFKSSYGMAVGVLRTRDLDSARTLVEKSFGNFIRRKRLGPAQERAKEAEKRLSQIQEQLHGLSLSEVKFYGKLCERMSSEKGILAYLKAQDLEAEQEIVETILPLARLGSGITLADGRTSALLGELEGVEGGNDGGGGPPEGLDVTDGGVGGKRCSSRERYVVLDRAGNVEAVLPCQMRLIDCAQEAGIPPTLAAQLAEMVIPKAPWVAVESKRQPVEEGRGWAKGTEGGLVGVLTEDADGGVSMTGDGDDDDVMGGLGTDPTIGKAPSLIPPEEERRCWDLEILEETALSMPRAVESAVPGHIQRQLSVMERVAAQIEAHPVHQLEDPEALARMSKEIVPLEEQVRQGWKTERKLKQPAWEEFLAVCRVLRRYGALKEADDSITVEELPFEGAHGGIGLREPKPTAFGRILGAINTDNELWMALIFTRQSILTLGYTELAALMPAVLNEYTKPDLFTLYGPSEGVVKFLEELAPIASELSEVQIIEQVDLPIRLDGTLCGLVEGWSNGCDWSELVASTSLDQGDLCRIIRRSMEMLRQIPVLPGLPAVLKDRARLAAESLDRFPVSDDTSYLLKGSATEAREGGQEEEVVLMSAQGPTPGLQGESEAVASSYASEGASGSGVMDGDNASDDAQRFRDYLDDDEIAAWEAGLTDDDAGFAEAEESAISPVEREEIPPSDGGSNLEAEDIDLASTGR